MAILSLMARLGLDKTGFDAGMTAAGKSAEKFGSTIKRQLAGAFGAAAVGMLARNILDTAGKLKDMSSQLGISVGVLQGMEFAATQSGSSLDDLSTALTRLSKARKEALANPAGSQMNAFAMFNVSMDDLRSMRLEELMNKIASAMRAAGDSQLFLAEAVELFGRGSAVIIPALTSDFEKLQNVIVKASEGSIEALDEWGDRLSALGRTSKGVATEVAGTLAGTFNNLAKVMELVPTALKAPFNEGGWMDLKAQWNTVRNMGDEREKFKINDWGNPAKPIVTEEARKQVQDALDAANAVTTLKNISQHTTGFTPSAVDGSNQFQRIGAFTGASADAAQTDLMRRNLSTLESIRDQLARHGIIVKTE